MPTPTAVTHFRTPPCVGWIDGIRKSLGPDRYTIRFTPRRPGSIWSEQEATRLSRLKTLMAACERKERLR